MKKTSLYLLLSLISIAYSCQNQGDTGQTANTTETTEAAGTSDPTAPELDKPYPSLPPERMVALYNNVDYIDFVFYYTNFSMNQSDNASIKATLSNVSADVPGIDPACQPIGSLFFQSKGQELIQAELYFTENCVYYVWLENGQRTYANKMTPNGFKFYERVFTQAGGQQ
ncbi:MAG: hypothetical protein R2824_03595 [Saprospiraceae bacterium]|nr:hypothetical protein [Lewinella sp.]